MNMLCLGIESTAHTFGCSVIEYNKNSPSREPNDGFILSETRDIYKAPAGWGIHPRDASKHHSQVATYILNKCLKEAGVDIKNIDLISYSAGPGLGPCLRVG